MTDGAAWTTYTPVLNQGPYTVPCVVEAADVYVLDEKWVALRVYLTVDGNGSGPGQLSVSLPVAAAPGAAGHGIIYDGSAMVFHPIYIHPIVMTSGFPILAKGDTLQLVADYIALDPQ